MTEQEQKAWAELVEICKVVPETYPNRFHPVVLAADAELTALRARIEGLEKELQAEKDVAQAAFNVAMEGK